MPRALLATSLAVLPFVLVAAKKEGPADLNLTDLDGRKTHLKDYRGKILVVNFWATWCEPYKHEMPMLIEAEKAWALKGVAFIGASLDDKTTRKKIPEFMKEYGIDFPVWIGATGDDLFRLGMGEAVPGTAFLNEDGVILIRVQGEIKKSELQERLEWITGDRSRTAPNALLRNLP
jgi:thiol-disulfide isomerase/thioredoxin